MCSCFRHILRLLYGLLYRLLHPSSGHEEERGERSRWRLKITS